jgi:hypothetical protein
MMRSAGRALRYLPVGILLTAAGCAAAHVRASADRTLRGDVYFTNNTPRDRATFPVELYTPDASRQVAATTLSADGEFAFTGIESGKYLVKLTWPSAHCTLWYRVDLTEVQPRPMMILMDVDCAHQNGRIP